MSGDEHPPVGRGPDGAGGSAGRDSAGPDGTGPEDRDLERALRAVFARRAEHIRSGPAWPSADDAVRRFRPRRPARRWLLPAAAAAVVATLVVTVIAVRGPGSPADHASPGPAGESTTSGPGVEGADDDRLPPAPTPVAQQPIPAGQQAVDALGVEIFVPTSLTVDPPCASKSVSRPAYGLPGYDETSSHSCTPEEPPVVRILTATNAADGIATTGACVSTVDLDGESGCIRVSDNDGGSVTASVIWPRHDVAIIADFPSGQRDRALAVVQSAHWVPVDRHGCAATRSPIVPANAAALPHGSVLPADAGSTSACWYSSGRLVASATLSLDAVTSLRRAGDPGSTPGLGAPKSYSPSPDATACSELGRTDGIVFQTTRPNGSIAMSTAQFADCSGGQYWTDGVHARPANRSMAYVLDTLAGFPLGFGYRAQPLDPVANGGTGASASDLPTTTGSEEGPVASPPVTGTAVTDKPRTDSTVTANTGAVGDLPPIPDGMQPVDALGVEIFVPKDLPLDPGTCTTEMSAVFRPVPQLPHGVDCRGLSRRTVQIIATDRDARTDPTASCQAAPILDGEAGCLSVALAAAPTDRPLAVTAVWPAQQVAIEILGARDDQQWALGIVRSAHPVSVDRNGCAVARSPIAVAGSDSPSASILPAAATSLSVCWYLDNRLGASALLGAAATARVIAAVNESPETWPPPANRPSLTPCAAVAQHDGVLLTAHLPDGGTAQAVGTFAACNGQQVVANSTSDNSYTHIVLATSELVSTIADAAGLSHALALDYPYPSTTPGS